MIKRLILIMTSLMMIFAFAGCQLAVESKGVETRPNTDALCGMFITFDYLDSNEDYLDNADWNAVINGDQSSLYNQGTGRIYAVPEDSGRANHYVFNGIEGLRLFNVFVSGDEESESYNRAYSDDVLLDGKNAYNQTDSGMEITLEATLYICPKAIGGDGVFGCFCNPVYQTPDGQVYMTAGTGDSSNMQTGISMSQTLSGTAEKTVNGVRESRKATVKLTVTAIDYIEKYALKEYDSEDRVISALEITKGNVPKEITLNENTTYAILEKHSVGEDGKPYVERSILDMNSSNLGVRFINEKGFAQEYGIPLKNIPASIT